MGVPDPSKTTQFKRSVKKQFALGLMANFSSIAPSMSLGFSAVALPALKNELNQYYLNPDQASWFASIASLATPVGCLLAGPIADRYGRRGAMFCVNIIGFIGWLIIASAYYLPQNQYPVLLIGRLFTGLSTGLCSMPASIYMAEIASTKLIGVFTSWGSISFSLGVLIVYVLGWFLKEYWGAIALISAIFPCIGMCFIVFFIPESPTWLISRNKYKEAVSSCCTIFGCKTAQPEVTEFVDRLVKNKEATNLNSTGAKKTFKTKLLNKIRYFRRPNCWKPFMIVMFMFFFQQFTGVFSIVFYAIDVCKAAGIEMDPYLSITLIGLVRLGTAILASFVSRKVGKKPLSIMSGSGMAVSMLGLATYIYLKRHDKIEGSSLDFLPTVLLMSYFFVATGFLIVPFAMTAEIFPIKIRGIASGLAAFTGYMFNFITVKTYTNMAEVRGIDSIFFMYGSVAIVGTIFSIFVLPETRNKTIQEIEDYFTTRKPDENPKKISLLQVV